MNDLRVGRVLLAPALSLAILGGCMFLDEVDNCLDRGGRWNDATAACELDTKRKDEASARDARARASLLLSRGRVEG